MSHTLTEGERHIQTQQMLEHAIKLGEERIATFAARLLVDPLRSFQWGGDMVRTAALISVGKDLLAIVNTNGVEAAKRTAAKMAHHSARYPTRSTSPIWNLTHQEEAAIYAQFAEEGSI